MLKTAMLTAALAMGPEESPRICLILPTSLDPAQARKAWALWNDHRGPKDVVLVVTNAATMERDLLRWLDVVPRGLALAPYNPEGLALLRRYDVRRLPCLLVFADRVHRIYGIPKEVPACSR